MHHLHSLSQRGLHLILSVLFFIIPLVYAWFYIPGIPLTLADGAEFLWIFDFAGFEKIKVFFFVGLMTLATICFLGSKRGTKKHLVILSVFMIWTLFSYLVNSEINPFFWFGNREKFHGWYLALSILILWIILSSSPVKEQKKYLSISLISGWIVCVYALFQKLGLDPIQTLYSSRLDETRIFSTLGNPNYLAGYVLMLMPLSLLLAHSKKILWWGLFGLLTLVLIVTKSLFGMGVFVGYLSYLVLYRLAPLRQKTRHIILVGAIGITLIVAGYLVWRYGSHIMEIQKIKGFIARYFLWETGIRALFGDIRNTLFGYGPDGFLPVSEFFRSSELSLFEDPAFRIDRSHNVWIDLLIHFGIPMGGLMLYSIFSPWKKLPLSHQEVLILFSIFFFFNIPVLVHYMLLLQILTIHRNGDTLTPLSQ